jgi:Mn2+/Fe2+ NRAMP family transporter
MLGTTISPYLFFWDTSEQVEEEISNHNLTKIGHQSEATKKYMKNVRLDNFIGMTLASLTAWFIVVACASTLNASGITEINTAADAAKALEPLVGNFPNAGLIAKIIFSTGIIGLGLLAVPVLAGSSSYAISEMLGWREGLYNKFKRAIGFYVVIIVAIFAGLIINLLGIDPMRALVFTAVFNGIAAVPLLFIISRIGNNKKIMGDYKNSTLSNILVRSALVIMTAAILILLYTFVKGM